MAGNPPNYDDVMMPGAGGIRIPTEVFGSGGAGNPGATMDVDKLVTVNFGAAHADHVLLPSETAASEIICTNANAAANVVWPAAFPGSPVIVFNNAGFAVTFKVTGQTGVAVATGKRALLVCESTDIARVTADT